jgi:hypothetical protein
MNYEIKVLSLKRRQDRRDDLVSKSDIIRTANLYKTI